MSRRRLRNGFTSGNADAAMEWRGATPEKRAKALVNLLLLTDAIPPDKSKRESLKFPRLDSTRFMTNRTCRR